MNITITINTDNAAFEEPNFYGELDTVCSSIAVSVEHGKSKLRDSNGNTCGTITISA